MSLFRKRVATAPAAEAETGERRQLTVLFYDIVGSTRLIAGQDPEVLRDRLETIHAAARQALTGHGGSLEQVLGDGGMAYFGYPEAREDSALDAVRAALALLAARDPDGPDIRIGIATSVVVLSGSPDALARGHLGAVGVAPNLAARLEAAAAPNSILVSDATHALTRRGVDYAAVTGLGLKGFPDVTRAWRPRALHDAASRYERDRDGSVALTGRRAEIASLRAAWARAETGQGQAVLIEGEPGIGKSRILADFRGTVGAARVVILQCQPLTRGEALFSVFDMLDRAYEDGSDPALVRTAGQVAARIATLEEDDTLAPEARRKAVLEAVTHGFEALCDDGPLLILAEDIHWTDEVTLAVLERLSERATARRLMVVATMRPDAEAPPPPPCVRRMSLGAIRRAEAQALVSAAATVSLTRETRDWIVGKADGNPLFLLELTAFAADVTSGGSDPLDHSGANIDSLRALLAARLDSAGRAKRVAQIASILGRVYPYHLLDRLASGQIPSDALDADVQRLVEHGLLETPDGGQHYAFRHALVRDVAYDSQLRSVRRGLHGRLVDLVDADPDLAEAVPLILLAEHCLAADRLARGLELLLDVADDAIRRSALHAPRRMLERVLTLSEGLEAGRDLVQLKAIALLGPLVTLMDGHRAAAPLYDRGQALYAAVDVAARAPFFAVLWGWWFTAGDLLEQARRSEVLITEVGDTADPESRLQALHCGWATLFDGGAHDRCLHAIEDGLALYDPEVGRRSRHLYGHDARVCGLGEQALCAWLTGRLEDSARAIAAAEAWADETGHLASQLHALDIATQLAVFRRDLEEIDRILARTVALAGAAEVPVVAAKRQIFAGWRAAQTGAKGQVALVTQGLTALRGFGVLEDTPFYADIAAEIAAAAGEGSAALGPLDQEIAEARRSGLTYWLPELLRRRAMLAADAEAALNEGFAVAQGQGARMLVLRNAETRLDLGLRVPPAQVDWLAAEIAAVSECALRRRVGDALGL